MVVRVTSGAAVGQCIPTSTPDSPGWALDAAQENKALDGTVHWHQALQ